MRNTMASRHNASRQNKEEEDEFADMANPNGNKKLGLNQVNIQH